MPKRQLHAALTAVGLNDKEADVYYAALASGPTTILKLARAARLKRTSVYSIVESLIEKGAMSEELRGFKRVFVAQHPSRLANLLEQKKAAFLEMLPQFASLYTFREDESAIKFYEGLEAIKGVYEGLLQDIRAGEEYMVISNMHHWYYLDAAFFQDFTERRGARAAELGFRIRLLVQQSEIARKHKRLEKQFCETIKFLPEHTSLTTNMVIIPKKVVIHQLAPPVHAMVLENPHVVRMHSELFEIIWRALP